MFPILETRSMNKAPSLFPAHQKLLQGFHFTLFSRSLSLAISWPPVIMVLQSSPHLCVTFPVKINKDLHLATFYGQFSNPPYLFFQQHLASQSFLLLKYFLLFMLKTPHSPGFLLYPWSCFLSPLLVTPYFPNLLALAQSLDSSPATWNPQVISSSPMV